MGIALLNRYIIFLIFLVLGAGQDVYAKKMYRWIDEHGNVFFSDKVPPEQVKHKRESLNKNARVLEVVEKEKTKEQRDLDKRLNLLRKQQEDIIAKQKSHDKVLLSTFRSLDDMNMALKGKMLALDGQRKVVQGNLVRLENQLNQQQKKAAQYERDGKPVPGNLLEKIRDSKQQIETTYVEISKQFEKKQRVRVEFEEDIKRFVFLTQSDHDGVDLSRRTALDRAENELGLFICDSLSLCDRAWENAKQFVYIHSTTLLDIETDKLIMSQAPYKDTDISLSVSRMEIENKKDQLFLDIRCRNSSIGIELCRSPKAQRIRHAFSGFIKASLEEDMKQNARPKN